MDCSPLLTGPPITTETAPEHSSPDHRTDIPTGTNTGAKPKFTFKHIKTTPQLSHSQERQQPQSSLIETTDPANIGDVRRFNNQSQARQRQNKQKQRKLRQIMVQQQINPEAAAANFPKYFSVKFPRLNLDREANPIAIEKDLKSKAGTLAAKVRKQNKDTLLVKVISEQQGNALKEIQEIATHRVEIVAHKSLNQSKGTVYSETLSKCSIEELEETLRNQQVIKVERIKRRVEEQLVDTHRHIISFNRPELPRIITLTDWHSEIVDLYIPKPMRCAKCQKLGHTMKWCRREQNVCSCCGEDHNQRACTNDPKCVNCQGDHRSNDIKCPAYLFRSEILATQTRQKCTYHEAEQQVKDRFREEGKTYSFALRRQLQQPAQEEVSNRAIIPENLQPTTQTQVTSVVTTAETETPAIETTSTQPENTNAAQATPTSADEAAALTPVDFNATTEENLDKSTKTQKKGTTSKLPITNKMKQDVTKADNPPKGRTTSFSTKQIAKSTMENLTESDSKQNNPTEIVSEPSTSKPVDSKSTTISESDSKPDKPETSKWQKVVQKTLPKMREEMKQISTENRFEPLGEEFDLESDELSTKRKRDKKSSPEGRSSAPKKAATNTQPIGVVIGANNQPQIDGVNPPLWR